MSAPLVSAIVPNHNYAASLELCLRALQNQTYRPVELIVVDDASTDDSVEVARRLGVRVVQTGRNAGVAAARNLGAAHARGEILVFADSDVAAYPDAVEVAVGMLAADPRLGAVCSIHDPEPLIRDSLVEEYRALQYHYWTASSEGSISFLFPALMAMRRSVFEEIGPFNTRLRETEEVDYGHRLTQRYDMVLTTAVRSRHDHDDKLGGLLRKLYRRGRARVPLYARRRRFARGFETSNRAGGSLAALAAVATLPAALLGPAGAALPALALAVSILADLGMYRFVLRRRGPLFLLYYGAVHFVVNVTIAAGVAAGVARWSCSPRFRRLYDPDPPVRPAAAGAGAPEPGGRR
ncbi:glycosyltransferase involved in cell wall biosynthesis [Thermocatellispora tengchongensis]|uniref:Glycosyltransferase involved in cell wall biosynthesis n=1 Tax=Thermocatellispora tengchongensis TaxID=1073253 RepID=A0A840PAZ3_9ACTN|nr:glycosyltransferase family A protein [Thermocatellispora tengchongensis]MBB5134570.1 glycosyltransferase involved in cell wall biosynthesis [Thermocatellispora tengchongensis]